MSKTSLFLMAAACLAATSAADAQAVVGRRAPAFSATDTGGRTRSLQDYQGKLVVLEWWSPECPFVQKHYGSGNLPRLQKEWTGKGVVWLTVNSSAAGESGHVDAAAATTYMRERGAAPTAVLLDPSGAVGRVYGAKTTPHMFVIAADGTLVYAGAIDDTPSTDAADVVSAHNYVAAALAELSSGKPVSAPTSRPYGCGVKYGKATEPSARLR